MMGQESRLAEGKKATANTRSQLRNGTASSYVEFQYCYGDESSAPAALGNLALAILGQGMSYRHQIGLIKAKLPF